MWRVSTLQLRVAQLLLSSLGEGSREDQAVRDDQLKKIQRALHHDYVLRRVQNDSHFRRSVATAANEFNRYSSEKTKKSSPMSRAEAGE